MKGFVTFVTLYFQFVSDICTMILNLVSKHKINLIGIVAGGVAGYLYYYFVGCESGTCMIASNPLVTVPYFAFLGYLLAGLFKKRT